MENNQLTVGLDIGTTKIVAMVGRRNEHGKIEILGAGKSPSTGVQRGMVTNIVHTVEAIEKAVSEARESSNVDIQVVNVGIAGQHIRSYQHRGVRMRDQDADIIQQEDIEHLMSEMYKLAMKPGEQIISVIPQEYIVDDIPNIKDPIGMMGARLEANFHIITGQMNPARNIYRCVEDAGLSVDQLILEPIASSVAVLTKEEKEAGVALIDIGGGTTDIAIFQDGIIRHTAVIPFGGNIITEDIVAGCNIIRSYAELLKTRHGYAISMPQMVNRIVTVPGIQGRPAREISVANLASIIRARMEEILDYALAEIESSGFREKLSAGVVLTGGGSQLRHVKQLTEFVTGLDARIGLPDSHIAGNSKNSLDNPIFSTAVGLMMMGFQEVQRKERDNNRVVTTKKPKNNRLTELIKNQFGRIFQEDDDALE